MLTAVNGASLPATIHLGSPRLDIVSETLLIKPDGTFEQNRVLRSTNAGQSRDSSSTDRGTYDLYVAAALLHFQSNGSSAFADANESTLNLFVAGSAFVYQKQ